MSGTAVRRYGGTVFRLVLGVIAVGPGAGAAAQSPVFEPAGTVRGAGMNGAGVALVGDAGAIFSNPAGIATISHIALEGEYNTLAPQTYMITGAFAWRLRQFDFGAGLRYFDAGEADDDRDLLAQGTLIYRFGMIALGGSLKTLQRRQGGVEDEGGLSADGGLAIAIFDIMALAFAIQNIGGNWDQASPLVMPRLTRLGFTMNYVDPQETFRLLSTVELQWAEGRGMRTVAGMEGGIVVSNAVGVIARGAYGSRPDGLLRPRLTYGVSVALTRVTFDYAYQPQVEGVGATRRFGVRLSL